MAKKKSFQGQSQKSIEEAIQDAISKDPKGDPGTDIFNYHVTDTKVQFGGFVETTTYIVTIER